MANIASLLIVDYLQKDKTFMNNFAKQMGGAATNTTAHKI